MKTLLVLTLLGFSAHAASLEGLFGYESTSQEGSPSTKTGLCRRIDGPLAKRLAASYRCNPTGLGLDRAQFGCQKDEGKTHREWWLFKTKATCAAAQKNEATGSDGEG